MDVVARLQELMNERGWTCYRLAKEAGLAQTTVSTMMNRDEEPKISTIDICCRAIGITLSEFFAEDLDLGEFSLEERKLLKDLYCCGVRYFNEYAGRAVLKNVMYAATSCSTGLSPVT